MTTIEATAELDSDELYRLAVQGVFGVQEEASAQPRDPVLRHKYWRKPNGWIAVGPVPKTDMPEYELLKYSKGWLELPDKYAMTTEVDSRTGMSKPVFEKSGLTMTGWHKDEALRDRGDIRFRIWFLNGGAWAIDANGDYGRRGQYLMPPEQVVSLGWHRDPAVQRLRPDVAGAVDLECKFGGCIDQKRGGQQKIFSALTLEEAERARNQHISAAHQKAEAAEAVGKQNRELIAELAPKFAAQTGADPTVIAATVAAVLQALGVGGQAQPAPAPAYEPPAYTSANEAPVVITGIDSVQYGEDVVYAFDGGTVTTGNAMTTANAFPSITENAAEAPPLKRQELMTLARERGYPWPERAMQMSRDEWEAYIREQEASGQN